MSCKIVKLGTFYMNSKAVPAPRHPVVHGDVPAYNGEKLTIKDTMPGKELTWVKAADTDILICDRNILCWVSFEDLQSAGFVVGRLVRIDGKFYCCRLIQKRPTSQLSDASELDWLLGYEPDVEQPKSQLSNAGELDRLVEYVPDAEMNMRLMSSLFWAVGWKEPAKAFYCDCQNPNAPKISSAFVPRAAKGPDIGFRPVLVPCKGAMKLTLLNTGDMADV